MASTIELEASARAGVGKGAARQARRDGFVPGVIYGGNADPESINIKQNILLKLLKAGLLIKEVAFEIGISEAAVKQRLRSAKDKLGARTTPHAVSVASEFGLI